jgi:ubiquinone/menaquinone biosynthesis C-methylase UbiE
MLEMRLYGTARDDQAKVFDEMHRNLAEPFDYSKRAAEILRHRFVYETVELLQPRPRRLLDIGCSRGQLTAKLTEISDVLIAIDVSRIAVAGAREACHRRGRQSRAGLFVVGSATALPFRRDSFDCMVRSDGLHSWQLSEHERRAALREATDALMPGGHVVLARWGSFAGARQVVQAQHSVPPVGRARCGRCRKPLAAARARGANRSRQGSACLALR